jgi:hypothetical protein
MPWRAGGQEESTGKTRVKECEETTCVAVDNDNG